MLPSLTSTTSPGTSRRAAKSCHFPSRSTRATGASRCRSAAIAVSALYSWKKPTPALISSMTTMMAKSSQRRVTPDSTAAISIIQGIGPQK